MSDRRIPLSVPCLGGNEAKYLQDAIESTWVSSEGPYVGRFERSVAEWVGAAHAVAAVNGTAALHVALLGAGVRPGDEVLVPALTFVATANVVTYCGASPVFVDIDSATWGMDPLNLRDFLETECAPSPGGPVNRRTGRPVRAVLPVHLLGHPADMDPIADLARRYGLTVVEDACEALGALYRGRPAGRLAALGCFSFNGNKVVTSGGGGMVVTDDAGLAARARHLTRQARLPGAEYAHDAVGFNYRLTNLCAAVGVAQMEQLTGFLDRKRRIAARYRTAFAGAPGISCQPAAPWAEPMPWLFTVTIEGGGPVPARRLVEHLAARGIEARQLFRPLPLLPIYASAQAYRVEVAAALHARAVSLPSSVNLTPEDQDTVIAAVLQWIEGDR